MKGRGIGEWAATSVLAGVLSTTSCISADCVAEGTCAHPTSRGADDAGADTAVGESDGGVSQPLVVIGKAPALVEEGAPAEIEVTVDRSGVGASAGPVRITLDALDGVSAAPLEIPAEASAGTLSVSVGARRHGKITLVLRAEGLASGARGTAEAVTTVRGSAGSLDTSFGDGGVFTHPAGDSDATGIVVQADGKIVLAGRSGDDILITRVLEDGRLDESFATKGSAAFPAPGGGTVVRTSDLVETSGGALAVAYVRAQSETDTVASVLRVTSSGVADPFFGEGAGAVGILSPVSMPTLASLISAPDGGLFVGGKCATGVGHCVVRLKTDGAVDTSWGDRGRFTASGPGSCIGMSQEGCYTHVVVREPSGELLSCQPRNDGSAIHRIAADGTSGTRVADTGLFLGDCGALVLDPSAAGFGWVGGNHLGTRRLVVMRMARDGGFVELWGNDGNRFEAPPETGLTFARRLAPSGGNLVVGAEAEVDGEAHLAVARLTTSGAFDATFAGKGYVTLKAGGRPSTTRTMALDALGRIIVAGTNGKMVAARFWP